MTVVTVVTVVKVVSNELEHASGSVRFGGRYLSGGSNGSNNSSNGSNGSSSSVCEKPR